MWKELFVPPYDTLKYLSMIVAVAIWSYLDDKTADPVPARLAKVFGSACLGIGLAGDFHSRFPAISEKVWTATIMAVGFTVLDLASRLLRNEVLMEKIFRKKLGIDDDAT